MKRPPNLNFESLTNAFMSIVGERYPSSDKVLQLLPGLGCDTVETKIVAITQFRNAVREVSPRIYRSTAHRDEVYMAIIEAAEELEDQLEEQISREIEED